MNKRWMQATTFDANLWALFSSFTFFYFFIYKNTYTYETWDQIPHIHIERFYGRYFSSLWLIILMATGNDQMIYIVSVNKRKRVVDGNAQQGHVYTYIYIPTYINLKSVVVKLDHTTAVNIIKWDVGSINDESSFVGHWIYFCGCNAFIRS